MDPAVRASSLRLETQVSLLSGADFWRTQSVPSRGVPSVVLSDGPHGLRYQADAGDHLAVTASAASTCFPPAATLASSWDASLVQDVAEALAVEALALGVDVVLGPGMNLKRHPLCGRNFEYYSEDPLLTGRLAAAVVTGLQSRGVGACAKHFAVNNQESHRFVVDVVVDERTLRELYLSAFEHVVRETAPVALMAAYNSVNGFPATENAQLLDAVLREEWGFEGLVMSDWGASGDRVAGIGAGMDLEMPGSNGLADDMVLEAVRAGRLAEADVSRSAQRVLDLAARVPDAAPPTVDVDLHHALARRAAAESTVVLKNDGLLPLPGQESVALIGAFASAPRYQGAGSSTVTPTRLTSTLAEMADRGLQFSYAPGYDVAHHELDDDLIAEAVEVARGCDVAVVMVGLPPILESEGFDRASLSLPAQHDRLVEAVCAVNARTVVVLSNGSPVAMPWRVQPSAILEGYLGGQASGGALVDVLYGDIEPAGRLAETFPTSLAQVAADPFFPGNPHQVEYREGLFVGYRYTTTAGLTPAYPFGHGLGYAKVEWTDVTVERPTLRAGEDLDLFVTLTNSAQRDTSDVVQVYLHDRTGLVQRPRRELASFAKVKLAAGESRTVAVTVPARAFAFYDVGRDGWSTPTGTFDIEVARSSHDVVATLSVEVKEGVDSAQSLERPGAPLVAVTDQDFAARLGRPVPRPRPVKPFTRDSTFGELSSTVVGRLAKRVVHQGLAPRAGSEPDPTTAKMLERALEELPLRAAASLSAGRLSWRAVDAVIDAANRRYLKAGLRASRGLVSARRSVASPAVEQ